MCHGLSLLQFVVDISDDENLDYQFECYSFIEGEPDLTLTHVKGGLIIKDFKSTDLMDIETNTRK